MLREKGVPYEVTEIDLSDKPDWFLRVSPYGKVPVIRHDGETIYESAIINEYLDEVFPDPPMLADTPAGRARMRIWIDFCNTRIQPGYMALLKAPEDAFGEQREAFGQALAMLEDHLARSGAPGPWFADGRFSLVDATYAPAFERFAALSALRGWSVPERLGRVRRWMEALAERPSVQATATPLDELVANYRSRLPEPLRASA